VPLAACPPVNTGTQAARGTKTHRRPSVDQ